MLDLSCRKRDGKYYVVTDRWQKFTDIEMNSQTLEMFSEYCDEFLIHAVDIEGKAKGIEPQIAKIMGEYCTISSTYAGGISSFDDLDTLKELGRGKIYSVAILALKKSLPTANSPALCNKHNIQGSFAYILAQKDLQF